MTAELRDLADAISRRSYVPYGNRPVGVVAVQQSGDYIPGVRVECASFPLTIPAIVNACTTVSAFGIPAPALLVKSRPFTPLDLLYVEGLYGGATLVTEDQILIGTSMPTSLAHCVSPEVRPGEANLTSDARSAARRAYVPISDFPVGCVVHCEDGTLIPGCNVEHAEWTLTLCAERNALGTVLSFGLQPESLFLSCPKDLNGTPCGACRQVIVEQAPEMRIWMDRGDRDPALTTAAMLLPDYYDGQNLIHRANRSDT